MTPDATQPHNPIDATTAQTPASATLSANRSAPLIDGYLLGDEIGRGGMGVVYRARDLRLDRDIAVKLLLPQFAGSGLAERFLIEARITGQLQHPGIPPVHAVGSLDDGRPWLAMKLIQGQPLSERGTQGDTLAIFEQICHAVGYAHAHGVIHRDLKPANIMVGAFGEVQVMDWGLAKVLANPEYELFARNPIARGDAQTTVSGSVKGTPAFMPPEQALGEIEHVNERSDVFGLGGVLCWMLTGQPPFVDATAESTRQLAADYRLDDAFARLDACGAEPEVIALAKKCLSAHAVERFDNGKALADAVAGLRRDADDRAKFAEVERGRAEVRRRLQLRLGGALAATFLLGAGIAIWQAWIANKESVRANASAEEARSEAARADDSSRAAQDQARRADANADRARERYKLALDAFNQMVFSIQSKLQQKPGLQSLRVDLLQNAKLGLQKLLAEAEQQSSPDSTLAWAHIQMGDLELQLGSLAGGTKEYRAGLSSALKLAERDSGNAEARRVVSIALQRLGDVAFRANLTDDARSQYQQALDIMKALVAAEPRNVNDQRDVSVLHNKLGSVALRGNQVDIARGHFQLSLDIRKKLSDADPGNVKLHRDLSISYEKLGDLAIHANQTDEALIRFRQALDLRKRIAEADPTDTVASRDLSISFNKLGDAALSAGLRDDARNYFQQSLDLFRKLAVADPGNSQAQRDLSVAFARLGDVVLRAGLTTEAMDHYKQSLAIDKKLSDADPGNAESLRDLSIVYERLGNVALRANLADEALGYYRQSLDICKRLADADPNNVEANRDLGIAFEKVGDAYQQMRKYETAIEWYRKQIDHVKSRPEMNGMNLDMKYVNEMIAACQKALLRESAPSPRIAK